MFTIDSDIRISFEQLGIKFHTIMDTYKDEFDRITKEAVANFDFETAIKAHVQAKIEEGLEEAYNEISLSEPIKNKFFEALEIKLGADDL